MKAILSPLQSQYKFTEVIIIHNDVNTPVSIKSEGVFENDNDYPSIRELSKWGYESFEEAFKDDMIDTIMLTSYEKRKDYEFALTLVNKINSGENK